MKLEIKPQENGVLLKIFGNLDAEAVASFKKQVYALVDEGRLQFVIDLSQCPFVDSMGLGALISLLRRVRTQNGDVKIKNVNKEVYSIFEITRLHRLFEITP